MIQSEFPPIQQRLMEFIRQRFHPGFNHYNVTKLVGDASSRQYYRYFSDSGMSFILAAYPEPFDTDQFSYKEVYDLLQEIQVPVPEIVDMDGSLGIVLQEDLGNDSLQKILRGAASKQRALLLRKAIDHIVKIQSDGSRAIKPHYEGYSLSFDRQKLDWEFGFFRKHYLGNYRKIEPQEGDALDREFGRISEELASYPRLLCHRDYHVRNMMVKHGILYVIDFQDARWGPPAYDLSSLLKDSLDLDSETVADCIDYYLDAVKRRDCFGLEPQHFEPQSFNRQFHLMCIQRLLKALGTYAYQIIARENYIYEQYMAGSLHRALLSLNAFPEFPVTREMVTNQLQTPQH